MTGKRDLSLRQGEFIAGTELAVGESPLLLLLANVSAAPCGLSGWEPIRQSLITFLFRQGGAGGPAMEMGRLACARG